MRGNAGREVRWCKEEVGREVRSSGGSGVARAAVRPGARACEMPSTL